MNRIVLITGRGGDKKTEKRVKLWYVLEENEKAALMDWTWYEESLVGK